MSEQDLKGEKETGLVFNGEPVKLKSPGLKGLKYFLMISKDMANAKSMKQSDIIASFNEDTMDSMVKLIEVTLKASFGDYTERQDEYGAWALQHNMQLLNEIMRVCTPQGRQRVNPKELLKNAQSVKGNKE